jgi:hypothetical protein
MNDAKEYIKSKHNGEIPYKYGADECARLMEAYAKHFHEREVKKLRLGGVVGRSEQLQLEQECYKSGEPCKYGCSGLCKESC